MGVFSFSRTIVSWNHQKIYFADWTWFRTFINNLMLLQNRISNVMVRKWLEFWFTTLANFLVSMLLVFCTCDIERACLDGRNAMRKKPPGPTHKITSLLACGPHKEGREPILSHTVFGWQDRRGGIKYVCGIHFSFSKLHLSLLLSFLVLRLPFLFPS